MNRKQVIRLTESQLHQIVNESVKRVLNENYPTEKNSLYNERSSSPLNDYKYGQDNPLIGINKGVEQILLALADLQKRYGAYKTNIAGVTSYKYEADYDKYVNKIKEHAEKIQSITNLLDNKHQQRLGVNQPDYGYYSNHLSKKEMKRRSDTAGQPEWAGID